jgi:hypothetical protein
MRAADIDDENPLGIFHPAIIEPQNRSGRQRRNPQAQPAKTTLFAGGKEPGLRANFFAPIKPAESI